MIKVVFIGKILTLIMVNIIDQWEMIDFNLAQEVKNEYK
jgi:hypothetical protein